jgi:hypothetical protein
LDSRFFGGRIGLSLAGYHQLQNGTPAVVLVFIVFHACELVDCHCAALIQCMVA